MIIKLIPNQIPLFWDAIKLGATQADEVDSKNLQPYLNELLHALLSDKAQCFASLDDNRVLTGVLITRIGIDKVTEDKFLFLQSIYVWKLLADQVWRDAYDLFSSFAVKEGCKYLSFNSRQRALWDRAEKFGFKEKTRTFTLKIG
jgi:hypothetical protein